MAKFAIGTKNTHPQIYVSALVHAGRGHGVVESLDGAATFDSLRDAQAAFAAWGLRGGDSDLSWEIKELTEEVSDV